MPEQSPEQDNGLTSFSLHAYDESSAKQLGALQAEQAGHAAFALPGVESIVELDPETVARRYLQQALESSSLPAFVTPQADGRTTDFTRLGTETVPLTGTKVVKFRQTLDRVPIYGTLVTVELDEDNSLVSLDSSLGAPTGVAPVATLAPAGAVKAVAAHKGYEAQLDGIVPRLHYYFDAVGSRWRLVYILEDVPVAIVRRSGAAAAVAAAGRPTSSRRTSWTSSSTPTPPRLSPSCRARRAWRPSCRRRRTAWA